MTQAKFLSTFLKKHQNDIIIGSLGTISKDLDSIPHPNKILVRGAMGCALGVSLGYALNTRKKVYTLIGDGAFLMKLGSLATLARYAPRNLKIIVLDNGCHASCGGQPTNFRWLNLRLPMISVQPIRP